MHEIVECIVKVAVIGSRNLHVNDLSKYLPKETTEIVSGEAKVIDSDAKAYAQCHGTDSLTEQRM